jgi:hypothetical protein
VDSPADTVAGILEGYAARGVFRGFSRGKTVATRTPFKMLWHQDQFFELILDSKLKTLRMPVVLPKVPSPMVRDFKEFIEARFSKELPEHRRVDRRKVRFSTAKRGGNLSLTLKIAGSDFEYAARKFIHLVHEVYLVFLNDGRHYDYLLETFDLDPDRF